MKKTVRKKNEDKLIEPQKSVEYNIKGINILVFMMGALEGKKREKGKKEYLKKYGCTLAKFNEKH